MKQYIYIYITVKLYLKNIFKIMLIIIQKFDKIYRYIFFFFQMKNLIYFQGKISYTSD